MLPISEASNYYHSHSIDLRRKEGGMEGEKKKGRENQAGRQGSKKTEWKTGKQEERREGNPSRKIPCSHMPTCPPLFGKVAEGDEHSLESPHVAFSSNLPQNYFTWFLLSHFP